MASRRDLLFPGLLTVVLLLLSRPAGATPPNIILILADDLGYECLGSYGGVSYDTPVLDALAADGVRFNHCYAQPVCTPSRVQLMTGRYNHRNYDGFEYLNPEEITFGTLLQEAGYATAMAGKWQLNGIRDQRPGWDDPRRPFEFGFDEFCLWQVNQGKLDGEGERYANPLIVRNGIELPRDRQAFGPDVFAAFVEDFVTRNRDGPFFVYYSMALVHFPFVPTPDHPDYAEEAKRYPDPWHLGDERHFGGMVRYMDGLIGRLTDHLDALGIREQTLVLFTGDNGTFRTITSKLADGREIRGGKGEMTDAGTRVPLVVSWPGTIPEGLVSEDLVDFSDFLPTLVEVAGARLPADRIIDGQSFLPQAMGRSARPREWVFSHYWGGRGRIRDEARESIRDRRWKLYDDGRLFDVAADPLEAHPVDDSVGGAVEARSRLARALQSVHSREE